MRRLGSTEKQKPVTTIPAAVVYAAAAVIPVASGVIVVGLGRRGAELVLLSIAVCLGMMAVTGLIAYMLSSGQFPPRLGRGDVQLPAEEVEDTATALRFLKETVSEAAEKVQALERRVAELEKIAPGRPEAM